jgi:hypothetical protein
MLLRRIVIPHGVPSRLTNLKEENDDGENSEKLQKVRKSIFSFDTTIGLM